MDIEIVKYTANAGFGIRFPSKTFIVLGENDIYIISPGPLNEDKIKEIKNTNKEIHIIAPNNFHNLYISHMKNHLPDAHFYGPRRSQKQSGVKLLPTKNLPAIDLKQIKVQGHKVLAETCFYHEKSGTLILTDIIFNMHHKMNLMTLIAMKMAGTYHKLGTSRLLKKTMDSHSEFKNTLKELASLNAKTIIPNHGDSFTTDELESLILKV